MIKQTLIDKIILILIGKIFTAVAGFFLFVILAKYLTMNDLGVYVFSMSVCVIITMTSNWGTNEYLFRECSANPDRIKELMREVRMWKIFLSLILGLFFSLYLYLDKWLITEALVAVLMLFAYIIDAQSMSYIIIRRVSGDNKTEAVFFSIRSALKLLTVYLIINFNGYFTDIIIGIVIVNFLGMMYLWMGFHKHNKLMVLINSKKSGFKELLYKASPFAVFTFIASLYSQNGLILSNAVGGKEVSAVYGVAIQFYQVALFIPVAINIAMQPSLTRLYESNSLAWAMKIKRLYKYSLIAGLISGLFLSISLPEILQLLFDERYIAAKEIVQICMLAFMFRFVSSSIVSTSLISANKIGGYNYTLIPVLFVNILLNLFLIDKYGASGAAISLLVSEIIFVVLGSGMLYRTLSKFK